MLPGRVGEWMRRYFLLIAVTVLIISMPVSSFSAQEEKTLAFDEKHKDRQCIFLLYDMNIKVNEDWSYVTKAHKKVKILKEGSRDMGEVPITYEKGRESVSGVKAFTIAPNGRKYSYSKIQDFKIYDGYHMYSDSMVKIITLPEVTIGSVLEQEFTVASKGMPIKNAFWYAYYVDSSVPIKEFNFTITMPKKLGIKYKEFGLTRKPKITEKNDDITYSWNIQDMYSESDDEGYLPPPTPESIKEELEFSSINSWKEISAWYSASIKKNSKVTPEIENTVKGVIKDKVTLKEKTRAILEYIQKNFRYVSMAFGDYSLEPHSTDQVFKNKYGDCKDLSLLTKVMLKAAGIESDIAMFNTEFSLNDPQYDLPIPSLFDHVLLLVRDPKSAFYIDPLLDGYDIGQYPLNFQAAYTFIINDEGGRFDRFPVFDEERNHTYTKRKILIEQDGSALIEIDSLWDLDSSIKYRDQLNSLDKERKDKFYEAIDSYLSSGGELVERRIDGLDEKYGYLKAYSKVKLDDAFPITDGLMVIEVNGYGREFDFVKKERKNPIFYPTNSIDEEVTIYRIPKGYSVSYVPQNLNLDIGFFKLTREYVKENNEIKITEASLYKRTQLPKEDYQKVKQFFDQLPTKTQQRILVKRGTNQQ